MTDEEIIDVAANRPIGRILSMLQQTINRKVARLVENSGTHVSTNDLKSLGIEIYEFIEGMKLVSLTINNVLIERNSQFLSKGEARKNRKKRFGLIARNKEESKEN